MKKYIFLVLSFAILFSLVNCKPKGSNEFNIAWSHYTGWEPWDYADNMDTMIFLHNLYKN